MYLAPLHSTDLNDRIGTDKWSINLLYLPISSFFSISSLDCSVVKSQALVNSGGRGGRREQDKRIILIR